MAMKIRDVETIQFTTYSTVHYTRWGYQYDFFGPPYAVTSSLTRIVTDNGVEGLCLGGDQAITNRWIKPLLVGEDPFDRERLWQWMYSLTRWRVSERIIGVIDMALWDLAGKYFQVPIHKLLGGFRDRVKAYASSGPNLGPPEVYADHADACLREGYTAYKVHPYIFYDPVRKQPCPDTLTFPRQDIAVCKAVRERVGDEMTLMYDPWTVGAGGGYSLEDALWVGRELEKLDFYWFEQPLLEDRIEAYITLCQGLTIPVLAPEMSGGSFYTRGEWITRRAADLIRMECGFGGITAVKKCMDLCEAYGVKCELHGGGFGHLQMLGATSPKLSEWYERGLLGPGFDYEQPRPPLKRICDPLDGEGNVLIPQTPGLGMELDWDYIEENRVDPL
jgi:L-alanine-DL-glutamate epimerase-like enolase superfamily enzyme